MHLISNIGFVLLAVWLIVTGLCAVFKVGHPMLDLLLSILAIAAGVFILIGR